MTPDQADNLRDLFMDARKTSRATEKELFGVDEMRDTYAADDAAVKAFMDAVAEMVEPNAPSDITRPLAAVKAAQDTCRDLIRRHGVYGRSPEGYDPAVCETVIEIETAINRALGNA